MQLIYVYIYKVYEKPAYYLYILFQQAEKYLLNNRGAASLSTKNSAVSHFTLYRA